MAKGKKTGGRTSGTPNKLTQDVKEAFQLAFDGSGGVQALTDWAISNPNLFYPLYSKLIPHDITSGGATLPAPIIQMLRPNE